MLNRVIIIGGAPGSGKSTLAHCLRSALHAVWVDYGRLREFHLKHDWSDQSPEEESITFENLIWICRNYIRHRYANVIVDDLRDERIRQIPNVLAGLQFNIVTLVVSDEEELGRRIIQRHDGWKNVVKAVEWNREVMQRELVAGEVRIDTAGKVREAVCAEAIAVLA